MSSAVSTNAAAAPESALCSLRPAAVISMRIRSSSDACARSAGFICADTGAHRPVTRMRQRTTGSDYPWAFRGDRSAGGKAAKDANAQGLTTPAAGGWQAKEQELSQTIRTSGPAHGRALSAARVCRRCAMTAHRCAPAAQRERPRHSGLMLYTLRRRSQQLTAPATIPATPAIPVPHACDRAAHGLGRTRTRDSCVAEPGPCAVVASSPGRLGRRVLHAVGARLEHHREVRCPGDPAPRQRRRSWPQDDFAIDIGSSLVGLFAAAVVLRWIKNMHPPAATAWTVVALAAIALSWVLTHTSYTLRYAEARIDGDPRRPKGSRAASTFPGRARPRTSTLRTLPSRSACVSRPPTSRSKRGRCVVKCSPCAALVRRTTR